MKRYFKELIIRFLPLDLKFKRNLLYDKYLRNVRFKGTQVIIKRYTKILRSSGLVLGKNVTIEGGGTLDATGGLAIGSNCSIDKNVNFRTIENTYPLKYNPIVIGAGNRVNRDVAPGEIWSNVIACNSLFSYAGQIVFVLSTGRSGSKSIAELLGQHSEIQFYHDSFPHLNTWACDILYNQKSETEITKRISALYNSVDIINSKIHGQSDQKLAPLVPILVKLFPKAKFIWLIRKADSFLSSSYPRGWFANSEFGYAEHKSEFFEKAVTPGAFDAAHRTNGFLAGAFSEIEWKEMTAFERNCWYWGYWNSLIEHNLSQLDSDRWMMIRLNELGGQTDNLLNFLEVDSIQLKSNKVNSATYKKISRAGWTDEMELIYQRHCENGMQKWFL